MKVTLNWLKDYVAFDWSPAELAERLTMLGIEVEGVQTLTGEFEGVVVAQVLTSEKHPNADKLSVCRVADGQGERQIVCGAKNYTAGDKVPLILPGHSLPTPEGEKPFTIKVSKMRGVESQGMLCSPKELGLADDASGLLILPPEAPVGQPFAQYLGRPTGEVIYDLEITPNRPDLNSVIGIAREISALTGNPLKFPDTGIPSDPIATAGMDPATLTARHVAVRIDDPDLCARYTARLLRGVQVGPSPDWLRSRLEKVGLRSINNVVDVTNFVMLEVGQPLHAFDYHLLTPVSGHKPTVVVRRAQDGEKFTTLDGQERALTSQMLLIADETKPIALAGLMGGQNTEINDQTTDVLLESAWFNPRNIRATSKRLDLRTDASYRFERGADIGICLWASARAAQLILQTAGGTLLPAVDAFPQPPSPKSIPLRPNKTNELLGIDIPRGDQIDLLRRLSLDVEKQADAKPADPISVRIPSFRVDLKREIDLIEEVCRVYGVDRIPSTPPRGAVGAHPYDSVHDQLGEIRRLWSGLGFAEAQGQTLISQTAAGLIPVEAVVLQNPLSSDMNVLRPSLLPGLLDALKHNHSRHELDVALFEIGRSFALAQGAPTEQRKLALALSGRRYRPFWSGPERQAKADISDLKGALEEFFEVFGLRGLTFTRRDSTTSLFVESATIQLGKQTLGELGQLQPALGRQLDLRETVYLAELNLDLLLARRNASKSLKPLPAFPSVRRDVALLVDQSLTHETVLQTIRKAKASSLENVELFDVYRGKNIDPDKKSLAYAFTYRHAERTLTDDEVNRVHMQLVAKLREELTAVIRE